jgi:hypothetical protein
MLNSPCREAAFVVNSELHTGARPSVRFSVFARCVHNNFSRRLTPDLLESLAGPDINAMETDWGLGNDATEFTKQA